MDKETTRKAIDAVMESSDFGIKEIVHWDKIKPLNPSEKVANPDWFKAFIESWEDAFSEFGQFVAGSTEVLIWLAMAISLVLVGYQIYKNRQWFQQLSFSKKTEKETTFQAFGLDIQAESLPEDIHSAAVAALAKGNLRAALSLLYRGALSYFVQHHHLKITNSTTEQDCLHLVSHKVPAAEVLFFKKLTQSWLLQAYAHYPIKKDNIAYLCQEWQTLYTSKST